MANIKLTHTESFIAGATLATNQYYGVKMSANRTAILMAAATDVPAGVVQNDPASGEEAAVLVVGRTPVVAGETLTAGMQIRFGADGKAYQFEPAVDTTAYCAGFCTIGADAGEKAEAIINCINPGRGIVS